MFDIKVAEDLNRDVFKSDSCSLNIPEVGLELQPGTLGSMYTTVEGLLDKIITNMEESNPFGKGDSAQDNKYMELMGKLKDMKSGKTTFTLELDDPLSNCFIYNPNAPNDDPQINISVYERTQEQNDDLGISDMKCD